MKIRNGFVSNSSTSSYIIAVKNINKPCPHCGRKDPDILDILDKSTGYNDNELIAKGVIEVIERLNKNEDGWDQECVKKVITKLELYIDNDEYIVAHIVICDHDENLKTIFDNGCISKNIDVIYSDCLN